MKSLFTRGVGRLQMCPLPEVQLLKNLFLWDLKVAFRTGSVYLVIHACKSLESMREE